MSAAASEDAWLADALRAFPPGPDTVLGLGHDVAAVRVSKGGVAVVATDVVVDGVHFDLAACGPHAAARKALAVNLSDLAAAACEPVAFLLGAVLPRPVERALFDALMEGFARAAKEWDCPCVGGDTNAADGPLVLSVTILGRPGPMGVVSRAGARVGDALSVTGPLGGSRQGRHLTFRPRIREARALAVAGVPRAMMDLSDGLSRDLPRLCAASGVGAVIDAEQVPVHADARAAGGAGDALQRALQDGEDFELLLAHAPLEPARLAALETEGVCLTRIGTVRPATAGIHLLTHGAERALDVGGWDHLAR